MHDLDKLILWCAEHDLLVWFNAERTEYDSDDEVVFLESYKCDGEMVFSLLHEIGHFIVQQHDDYSTDYADKLRSRIPAEYAAGVLREEVQAWNRGYELAQALQLQIDSAAFWQLSARCLAEYQTELERFMKGTT